jgi:hypothetical protein
MKAIEVYSGSDGELTKRYYQQLEQLGPVGILAMNLFRAQKCSARAKVYRGGVRGRGSYRSMAYERKSWSMGLLASVLSAHGRSLGVTWGWKQDQNVVFDGGASWVMYVDLPNGQVSFHSPTRMPGPDYAGEWCGEHRSEARILEFCDGLTSKVKTLFADSSV